jgi:shikimate dehydrogenase
MIYNPPQTRFLSEADANGFKNANGLSMLVYQAAKALEIWTGREISAEAMFEAANSHFGD